MSAHRTPPPGTAATTQVLSGDPGGDAAGGARPGRRLLGVDAARGLALFGMVAVHTLPSWDEQTGAANLSWTLFAGHSAALFATLAGVSLAFASGGRTPRTGRRMTATRWALAGRAGVIALVGFLLGFLALPVSNILIYYGLLFLLAVPFLRLRTRSLLLWAALFALAAPFLMQWSLDVLPGLEYANPSLVDLVVDPGTVLSQLLLTGVYPALPWMAFLLAGLAIGRTDLTSRRVQILLAGAGAAVALLTWGFSVLALRVLGGYEAIVQGTPWMDRSAIDEVMVFGGDPSLPTDTLWWLLIPTPHSNTPVFLVLNVGLALSVLGICLLLERVAGRVLAPIAAAGAMTFTLYTAHLLILWPEYYDLAPMAWTWGQIVTFTVFALLWKRALGQGPLEKVVTRFTRAISRGVLARGGDGTQRPAPWSAPRGPGRR
ncbi:heparan-alpha-glucosaminide N-acetyltransferase domain-containing protein [uncultured Kocuria sp.]|uniref:heparan-alpha-glucosaminide N-acetyltransferase domain-containing protein n=1 Tax=uncultured Kocuria sp. TaxID=259305 RepID=UPI0026135DBB|nr:heparan-alpha-glucosaminide N-acetyltransferase domain-containing protein [uncultured Kocuria sp.]